MMEDYNKLTEIIIGRAIEVHRLLGPGLLESAYRKCLAHELRQAGLTVEEEKPLPVVYKDIQLDQGYRLDILVNGRIVLELKSIDAIAPVHSAQMLTYLKFGGYPLGLLINFNVTLLKEGLKRFAMSKNQ
ncbi:MAG: GxxExxY protein [Saprospiraceae bacterium]